MQAIIMAAGRGSRLGHLTDEEPKAFLKVKNVRLIEYNISLLHHFGVRDIVIVTGYKADCFERLTRDIPGVTCVFNPFYSFMNVLGSFYMGMHALRDDDTIYMHADTLCAPEIMERIIRSDADLALPVEFKACDEEAMKVLTQDGRVKEISKQIDVNQAEGEFIGIAKIRAAALPAIRSAAKELLRREEFKDYFESAVQYVIDEGKFDVRAIPTEGAFWGEVDNEADYAYVCDHLPESLLEIAERF